MRILVVDDSKAMRMIVARSLRQAEIGAFEMAEAPDGEAALALIVGGGGFDLVIADWNMPKMTGIELLTAVRNAGLAVDFGFVSAETTAEFQRRAKDAGARFFVTKPFTPEVLREAVLGGRA